METGAAVIEVVPSGEVDIPEDVAIAEATTATPVLLVEVLLFVVDMAGSAAHHTLYRYPA